MLELLHKFLDKYCAVTELEQLQMYTDSLYQALSEHDLFDCIQPAMKKD